MTDILGPANADNATTTRPTETRTFGSVDSWFRNCSTPTANDGTEIDAVWLNQILAELRIVYRGNGNTVAGPAVVAEDNGDGEILAAILHLFQRGQPVYALTTGTANAYVATLTPQPAELKVGMHLRLIIHAACTSASTLTITGVGGTNPIIARDGGALLGGDLPAAPAGFTWNGSAWVMENARAAQGVSGRVYGLGAANIGLASVTGPRFFGSIACSSDGLRMTLTGAVAGTGNLYASTDGGQTFASLGSVPGTGFSNLVGSSDGMTLAGIGGAAGAATIYTSTNGGASWTARTGAGSRNWDCLAMSGDGQKILAGDGGTGGGGLLWLSTDGGASWSSLSAGTLRWTSCAMSRDGLTMVASNANAASPSNYIYASANGGSSWGSVSVSGLNGAATWFAVSSDGTRIFAADGGATSGAPNGSVWMSTNKGTSWSALGAPGKGAWSQITISADGLRGVAFADGARILSTADGGQTWLHNALAVPQSPTFTPQAIGGIASSGASIVTDGENVYLVKP